MPNSVSEGFGTALKMSSMLIKTIQTIPHNLCEFQVDFPLLRIRINQDKPIRIPLFLSNVQKSL